MKWQFLTLGALVLLGVTGCSETETPSTMRQRQDAALRDPWKYSPHEVDQTDISGGGVMEFKNKAFKRDLDSVLNP
jgi:hypothetical protein